MYLVQSENNAKQEYRQHIMFGKNCIVYVLVKKNVKLWLKQIWYLSIFRHYYYLIWYFYFSRKLVLPPHGSRLKIYLAGNGHHMLFQIFRENTSFNENFIIHKRLRSKSTYLFSQYIDLLGWQDFPSNQLQSYHFIHPCLLIKNIIGITFSFSKDISYIPIFK